ncbi:MAG: SH3 domain-containing protein [Anaerolineae bacterium]|nr:SH3 domain-containing protein [Anaerolineae bacterium]
MHRALHLSSVLLVTGLAALVIVLAPAAAQDGGTCEAIYQGAVGEMLENCFVMGSGYACGASGAVTIDSASGLSEDTPGIYVALGDITALHLAEGDGSTWSMARLHIPDPVSADDAATIVVFGPAELTFEKSGRQPPGSVLTLTAAAEPSPCADVALPGLLVQSPEKSITLLAVNGVEIAINGTARIHLPGDGALTVSAITRETILAQTGTVVFAGYSATITGEVPTVAPFDPAAVAHLPTEILPRMLRVALPGAAAVIEQTNLHLRPDPAAYTGTLVRVGLPVSVFGQSSGGDFVFVRTYDNLVGWVPLAALDMDISGAIPVFDTALPPLSRPFGPVQGRGSTNSEMNNLRDGPGQSYTIVITVPYGSEVNIYGRSPDGEWLLVESADGVRAWISAYLIDPLTPYNPDELPLSPDFPG